MFRSTSARDSERPSSSTGAPASLCSFAHGAWLRKGARPDRCGDRTGACRRPPPPSRPGARSGPARPGARGRASSSSSHPPSGPMATTGWAREGGSPPGWARHGRTPGRRRPAPPPWRRRPPRAARAAGTGRTPPGPPGAAGHRPLGPAPPPSAPPSGRYRRGTMRSTPSSVSFWTTHSGRSPLAGAKATVIVGRRPRSACVTADRRATRMAAGSTRPAAGAAGQPARHPGPGAVGGHHQLAGPQAEDVEQVVGVALGEHRGGRVVHEDHGRPPTQHRVGTGTGGARRLRRPPWSAEGRAQLREHPLAWAASNPAPRPGPRPARPAAPAAGRRARSGCPPRTWTKRSPRPRPRSLGTPSPFRVITAPVWVPAAMVRSRVSSRVSKPMLPPKRGQGHRHVHRRRGGPHRSARRPASGSTDTWTNRAPLGPPRNPAGPWPARRRVEPSSTPAGMSTVRVRALVPPPLAAAVGARASR